MMNLPKLSVLIVILVLIEVFHFGAGRTSPSFVFGNSSYTFHKNSPQCRDWIERRERCKIIGSDLVSIESKKEWIFLKETIQKYPTPEYSIGLKKERSGEWRWISDNSKVNATRGKFPWAKGEPQGDGNCAVMYKDYRNDYGLFNDLSCIIKRKVTGYICESSVNSNDQEVPTTVKPTSYRTEGGSKGSGTKTPLRQSLAVTSAVRLTRSNSPSTEARFKDNCQGVCLDYKVVETTATSPMTISSTRKDATRDPEEGKQAYEKDNCPLLVIILASLVAVLSVALLIFGVCLLSWRKKQRKDTRKATNRGTQLDNQDGSLLSPENAARQLGFSDEPEPHGIRLEYQRQGTDQDSRQECQYTMLSPRTMMVPGDSSYASLTNYIQEECTDGSSAGASPLLQQDAEPYEELPKYINVTSAKHI